VGVALAAAATSCRDEALRSENVPDIPVYPGSILVDQFAEENRDPTDMYNVPDVSPDEVLDWYRDRMADVGWIAVTDETDDVILYNDADGCYAFVSATLDADGVLLQISQQRKGTTCIPGRPLETPED
jgi:hypothetical protein